MNTEARNSMVLVAGTAVTAGLGMLYARYVGIALGPALFGDYAAAMSLIFICTLATGVINPVVTRFAAEYKGRGEHGKIRTLAREMAKWVSLYGLGGAVVALVLVRPLVDFFHFRSTYPLLVSYAIIYLTSLLSVVRGVMRGVQHFGQLSVNGILESAFRLVLGLVLLAVVVNAASALAAYAIAIALVLAISPWQMRSAWAGQEARSLDGFAIRRLAGPLLLMTLAVAGFTNLDMLVVKRTLGETDAGVYGGAVTLARMISVLVTPFSTLMLPVLTTLYEKGEKTTPAFLRISGYFLVLVAVPVAACCVWPEWIMVTFYDERYAGAGAVLTCLVIARLLGYLADMIGLLFAARNTFGFLYVYLPCLAGMMAALTQWHATPLMTAVVVLIAEAVTLTGMVAYLWSKRKRKRVPAAGRLDGTGP